MRRIVLLTLTLLLLAGPTIGQAAPTAPPTGSEGTAPEAAKLTRKDCEEKTDDQAKRACQERLNLNKDKPRPRPPAGATCLGERVELRAIGGDLFVGTEGDDVIAGDAAGNLIDGNGGVDRICGGDGDDEIRNFFDGILLANGGAGDDVLLGSITNFGEDGDRIDGGKGEDFVIGSVGNDRIRGGAGNDDLDGHEGIDRIEGGEGADDVQVRDFEPGDAADTVLAGPGDDSVFADDDKPDVIDCGPGGLDSAMFDADLDEVTNCEAETAV